MWDNIQDYLKPEQMQKGKVYKVYARNFKIGVWDGVSSILGIRYKFNCVFIDKEYHWDLDPHYGTCKPICEIGELPNDISLEENNKIKDFLQTFAV